MDNSIEFNKYTKEMLNLFTSNFNSVYRYFNASQKLNIQKYIPTIYNKWYYNTLLPNTVLSPANIFSEEYKNKYSPYGTCALNIKTHKTSKGALKYDFTLNQYSTENHPVVEDLKFLVSCCLPDASLTDENMLEWEYAEPILNNISNQDIFYLDYLTELALNLNLIEKITSIYSNKIHSTKLCYSFFNNSQSAILAEIIKSTISLCTFKLSENVFMGQTVVTEKMLKSFLKKPLSTDAIFKKIYTSMGLDIDKIMSLPDDDDLSVTESILITSTFYFGIVIDRWFFSIFGTYLKLIQPIYFESYNFKEELNFLCSSLENDSDIISDFFSPCTCYSLTPLGDKIFLNGKKSKNIQNMPSAIDMHSILMTIKSEIRDMTLGKFIEDEETIMSNIYTFKIKNINDKQCWMSIEIEDSFLLHEFSNEIFYIFGFEENADYRFTINDIRGYTHVFVPENIRKSMLKSSTISIDKLNLIPKQKFLFTTPIDKSLRLEIELLKISEKKPNIIYPRIVRQSKSAENNN